MEENSRTCISVPCSAMQRVGGIRISSFRRPAHPCKQLILATATNLENLQMPRQHMLLARFDSHTQALNVTIVTGVLPGAFFAPSRAGSTVNPVDFFDLSHLYNPTFGSWQGHLPVELDWRQACPGCFWRQYSMGIFISRHPSSFHFRPGPSVDGRGVCHLWLGLHLDINSLWRNCRPTLPTCARLRLRQRPWRLVTIPDPKPYRSASASDELPSYLGLHGSIRAFKSARVDGGWHRVLASLHRLGLAHNTCQRSGSWPVVMFSWPLCRRQAGFRWHQGNNDLLMFFLTVVGLYVFGRCKSCSLAMVAAATMLKVYPIILFPVLVSRDNGRIVNAGIVGTLAACLGFWLYNVSDLQLIRTGNSALVNHTYGLGSLHSIPRYLPSYEGMLWETNAKSELVFFIVCAVCAVCIFLLGFIGGNKSSRRSDAIVELFFIGGATIYTGIFVLGNNWDYETILSHSVCTLYHSDASNAAICRDGGVADFNELLDVQLSRCGAFHSSSKVQFVLTMFIQLAKCSLCALLLYELGQVMRRRLTAAWNRAGDTDGKAVVVGARATP